MENVTDYIYDQNYYESYPTGVSEGEECEPASFPQSTVILPLAYCLIFVTGFLGNGLLISAIGLKCRAKRQMDIFVLNLAMADLVFLVTLPLWVDAEAWSKSWRSGLLLCRLSGYVVAVTAYSSVLFLTCMSLDRYLAIVHPVRSRRFRSKAYTVLACLVVWIASLLLGLPVLHSRTIQTQDEGRVSYCMEDPETTNPNISLAYLVLTFFCPMLVILVCYCSIAKKLCLHYRRSKKQDVKLRKSIRVVFLVVMAFLISWLPFNIFRFLGLLLRWGVGVGSCSFRRAVELGVVTSAPLAFANSCSNPIIYCLHDSSIQKAMLQLLQPCLKALRLSQNYTTSDGQPSRSLSSTFITEDPSYRRRSAHHALRITTWASNLQP
ncbi:G-protein coupled receptor 15-like [Heterodontus francisci]|uniref:G-protein coupled receptor 15-like n=1 Tax=Heterodontus francisci TaxID=7792 RepID=UPI00355C0227